MVRKMGISLSKEQKGVKISLEKACKSVGIDSASLKYIRVGLGWDANSYDTGAQFDLDASAFLCGADGKALSSNSFQDGFVFYGNKTAAGVEHTGDNRTGDGDGDDESIKVNLSVLKPEVERIAFSVTIDKAEERNQNFGMVSNSYIRILDDATNTELIKYDLGEDYSVETALVAGELYKHNGQWKFNAIGQGFQGGLHGLCTKYGVPV